MKQYINTDISYLRNKSKQEIIKIIGENWTDIFKNGCFFVVFFWGGEQWKFVRNIMESIDFSRKKNHYLDTYIRNIIYYFE